MSDLPPELIAFASLLDTQPASGSARPAMSEEVEVKEMLRGILEEEGGL